MLKGDELGNRMKNYESKSKLFLIPKVPVIIRCDGKSFHTFCRRFEKPYDERFNIVLGNTMQYVCKHVQGVKMAQRHSDEISFLVSDQETIRTAAFFDYEVQKVVSVVASLTSTKFCQELLKTNDINGAWPIFDCRCFNLPEFEIGSYFWWRMLDAKRNSIQSTAQSKFSQKTLHGKNQNEMQEMLFQQHGINWAKLPQERKTGMVCIKEMVQEEKVLRSRWIVSPAPAKKEELDLLVTKAMLKKEN